MILKPMMDSHKTILWAYLASLLPQSEEQCSREEEEHTPVFSFLGPYQNVWD